MRKHQSGMSLTEVLIGLAILSIMIMTTITTTSTALKLTKNNVNKEFATQKAISMLEELRSLVQTSNGTTLTFLDAYDDGTQNKYILTTQGQANKVTLPADLISGNVARGAGWLYERRISVQPVPGQGNDVRFVNVKVYINEDGKQRLLAEVASVLRTLVVDMPPTQVYDVYAVAVENVPGWWVYMSNNVPFVKSTIMDMQARNPGLVFRMHWINTLSYGRDWQYKPYINDRNPSTEAPNPSTNDINWAYFYPGRMPTASSSMPVGDDYYYPWFLFQAAMNRDDNTVDSQTTTENGYDAEKNPWPYAIADGNNNAMRYYDELAYYEKRRQFKPTEEMTWRLLIEKMYSEPQNFTNAIVINLHGELLPFPPVRNYSDAAKSPETYPNIRAVTHPEQLRYTNDDDVKLRVYTYRTDPDSTATGSNYLGEAGGYNIPVTIKISGTKDWTPSGSDVKIIRGGTNQDATAGADPYDSLPINAPTSGSGNQAYYQTSKVGQDVYLKLYKSPLKHPQVGTGGLNAASRLYGLEYIPSPLEDLTVADQATQFTLRNLSSRLFTFLDTFSAVSFGNNNGDASFTGNWTVTNDTTNPSTGLIRIDSNRLRITDDNNTNRSAVERQLNLQGQGKTTLSFDYTTANTEAGDTWNLDVYNGTTWKTLQSFEGAVSGTFNDEITDYNSATTKIRFALTGGFYHATTPEYLYIDNVKIETTPLGYQLPQNTARWIITIPKENISNNQYLTIETKLGESDKAGVMYPPDDANVPPNLSRTYVWRGTDTWVFGDGTNANLPHLPITEQFQFLGDPRHLPYADLKRPHVGSVFADQYESRLGMGYNRYFDDFECGTNLTDCDANDDKILDGNAGVAEIVSNLQQNYSLNSGNRTMALIFDGVTKVSVNLTTGTRTASQVATDLNNNAAFALKGKASVLSNRLRIRSNNATHLGSVQYDYANGTNGSVFELEGARAYGNGIGTPWPGWFYDNSGVQYGINNNDNPDDDGWSDMEIDVHRAFQIMRSSLIQSQALWTTMTGYSYYYMGIGNEIGYDAANNFPNSIPVSTKPYSGTSGSNWEQTIINDNGQGCTLGGGCGVKYVRQQSTPAFPAQPWWALSWIGELYPDSQYAANSYWKNNGNLRTGTGSSYFVRSDRRGFHPMPGTNLVRAERRTGPRGSTTMFWGETANSAFHHASPEGNASILADGIDIRENFELPVPDSIPNNRPWQINMDATGDNPPNFLASAYPLPRRLQLLDRYFQRDNGGSSTEGSSLVAMSDPYTGRPAFVVVNGLSPTGVTGTTFIAKWSFLTLIQSYLNGGKFNDAENYPDPDGGGPLPKPVPGTTFHIRQLPRIVITEPNINTPLKDPGSVKISWSESWTRWDGKRYSNAYTSGCEKTTAGCYTPPSGYDRKFVVMYSPSNGAADAENGNPTGWFYPDGTEAKLGERNLDKAVPAGLTYTLSTPKDKFPEGNYLFRVEVYRVDYPQHYAFHQYRAYIQR